MIRANHLAEQLAVIPRLAARSPSLTLLPMNLPAMFAPLAARGPLVYFCYRPADGRVLYVSPSYEHELAGRVEAVNDELPGWLDRLHPDDRPLLDERLRHAAAGAVIEDVLLRLPEPDGAMQWLNLTAVGFTPEGATEADGPLISGYVRDVTRDQRRI